MACQVLTFHISPTGFTWCRPLRQCSSKGHMRTYQCNPLEMRAPVRFKSLIWKNRFLVLGVTPRCYAGLTEGCIPYGFKRSLVGYLPARSQKLLVITKFWVKRKHQNYPHAQERTVVYYTSKKNTLVEKVVYYFVVPLPKDPYTKLIAEFRAQAIYRFYP